MFSKIKKVISYSGLCALAVLIGLYFAHNHLNNTKTSSSEQKTPFEITNLKTGWTDSGKNVLGTELDTPLLNFNVKNISNQPISSLIFQISFIDTDKKQQFDSAYYQIINDITLDPGYSTSEKRLVTKNTSLGGGNKYPNLKAVIKYSFDNGQNFSPLTTVDINPAYE